MTAVLATLYEAIADLAIAIQPVIPASAAGLLDAMGIPAGERDYAALADEGRYAPARRVGLHPRRAGADLPAARSAGGGLMIGLAAALDGACRAGTAPLAPIASTSGRCSPR